MNTNNNISKIKIIKSIILEILKLILEWNYNKSSTKERIIL